MERVDRYLDELRDGGLEVILVPPRYETNCDGKIRAAVHQNPKWYQRFCRGFENCRGIGRKRMKRPRTIISRVRTIRALERILEGNRSGIYAERLLEFIGRDIANDRYRANPTPILDDDEPLWF